MLEDDNHLFAHWIWVTRRGCRNYWFLYVQLRQRESRPPWEVVAELWMRCGWTNGSVYCSLGPTSVMDDDRPVMCLQNIVSSLIMSEPVSYLFIPRMTKNQKFNLVAFRELDDLGSIGFLFRLAWLHFPWNVFSVRSIISGEKGKDSFFGIWHWVKKLKKNFLLPNEKIGFSHTKNEQHKEKLKLDDAVNCPNGQLSAFKF